MSYTLRFNTAQDYLDAKALELETIVIGLPVYEADANGLPTGAFLCYGDLNAEQLDELETHGIAPYQAPIEG